MINPDKAPGGKTSRADIEQAVLKLLNAGLAPDSEFPALIDEINKDEETAKVLKGIMAANTPVIIEDIQKV